jgi:hypothetical protein
MVLHPVWRVGYYDLKGRKTINNLATITVVNCDEIILIEGRAYIFRVCHIATNYTIDSISVTPGISRVGTAQRYYFQQPPEVPGQSVV